MKKIDYFKKTIKERQKEDGEIRVKGLKRIEDDIENGDIVIPRYDEELMDFNEIKRIEWNNKNPQEQL